MSSAIADLIAAAREEAGYQFTPTNGGESWSELADAAEKELAALQQSHDAHAEGVEFCAEHHAEPRIDLEALRKALREAAENAQLPPHFQWSESNREKFRFGAETAAAAVDGAFLAQLGGAKGQPQTHFDPRYAKATDAPKPEAQTCPDCGGKGVVCSEFTDTDGVPVDETCDTCDGTGKVGGGK